MKNQESYGEILKNLRINNNESLQDLSQKIGISKSHISEYENSLRKPTLRVLLLYRKHFHVSLEYLTGEYTYHESIDSGIQSQQEHDALKAIQKIYHDKDNEEYQNMELLLFSSLYQTEWGISIKQAIYNYLNSQDINAEENLLKEIQILKRLKNDDPTLESWEYTLITRNKKS